MANATLVIYLGWSALILLLAAGSLLATWLEERAECRYWRHQAQRYTDLYHSVITAPAAKEPGGLKVLSAKPVSENVMEITTESPKYGRLTQTVLILPGKPKPLTTVLDCGCTVRAGWRCPVHSCP